MAEIKYVDNIILKKDLFDLYSGLIQANSWNLSRSSTHGVSIGTFPGFVVRDNYTDVSNHYWNGYFTSLYEKINMKFYEKYNYELPSIIQRIHLGAKNETSITSFHDDTNDNGAISVLGFITPQWSQDWGGDLQIEENKINFEPGKFVIFDSNQIHNGTGPSKKIPYWRISINYIIRNK
tara:strand:- start:6 stop:542 length:537 start_codon:yes stop_codon:yes gene_type:complete